MYYTASGIITPVGGRPVHRLRADALNLCISDISDTNTSDREAVQRNETYDGRITLPYVIV